MRVRFQAALQPVNASLDLVTLQVPKSPQNHIQSTEQHALIELEYVFCNFRDFTEIKLLHRQASTDACGLVSGRAALTPSLISRPRSFRGTAVLTQIC